MNDPLHQWHEAHESWARAQLNKIPVEQLEWDPSEVAHAAVAYGAGLDAGLNAGFRMGRAMR